MKRIKIRPHLVDHSLLKPVPSSSLAKKSSEALVIRRNPAIQQSIATKDNSMILNLIGLVILCIIGYIMYNRYLNRDTMETQKRHSIIGFNHYVTKKLDEESSKSS